MPLPERLAAALDAAQEFVRREAGFAQVTTLDSAGFPTARTVSAFVAPDWSVELVQRRGHRRLAQLRRDPRLLVTWSGAPAPDSRNDSPAVFDLGLLIPRVVFVQGHAVALDDAETWEVYARHDRALRERGLDRAPRRGPDEVAAELAGVRVRPRRIRLEGFGDGPEAFTWTPGTEPTQDTAIEGGARC